LKKKDTKITGHITAKS